MDSFSSSETRIIYSFPRRTFDLRSLCPAHACDTEGGLAQAVHLDGRWPRLFRRLRELDLVLACAGRGPVSMAAAWAAPELECHPGADHWLCLESGAEIRPAAFGGCMAVVEQAACGQQMASLQFFDRDGEGCLKLLLTNGSDLEAFESLVRAHAGARRTLHFGRKTRPAPPPAVPCSTEAIHAAWEGLARSLPDSAFPGLEGVPRHDALAAAGVDKAWRLPCWVARQALKSMTEHGVPLGGAVRNSAVFLPVGLWPRRQGRCQCGVTYFGETSQLTLRRMTPGASAWATRFTRGGREVLCMEFYDEHRQFAAGLGVRHEAAPWQRELWNESLRVAGGV